MEGAALNAIQIAESLIQETASHSLIEFWQENCSQSHMNPILASGIVSLGKEVYDRLNTPSPSKLSIDDISFGEKNWK